MQTLEHYLDRSIDFDSYLQDIDEAILEKKSLWEYSDLNIKRMRRIRKTFSLSDAQLQKLQAKKPIELLIISEGWCGDASQILPIVVAIAESANWKYGIVYRDENVELMDQYLTNGAQAIPIIIGMREGTELFRFGPRTKAGFALLKKYKDNPETYTKDEFHKDLQQYYNQNKGNDIFEELLALIP